MAGARRSRLWGSGSGEPGQHSAGRGTLARKRPDRRELASVMGGREKNRKCGSWAGHIGAGRTVMRLNAP